MLPRRYFSILEYVFEFKQGLYIHEIELEHNWFIDWKGGERGHDEEQ